MHRLFQAGIPGVPRISIPYSAAVAVSSSGRPDGCGRERMCLCRLGHGAYEVGEGGGLGDHQAADLRYPVRSGAFVLDRGCSPR